MHRPTNLARSLPAFVGIIAMLPGCSMMNFHETSYATLIDEEMTIRIVADCNVGEDVNVNMGFSILLPVVGGIIPCLAGHSDFETFKRGHCWGSCSHSSQCDPSARVWRLHLLKF
jgi:hypothetical protein